jgi:hypothetical protein
MGRRLISEDLIFYIDKLNDTRSGINSEDEINPLVSIITPEWYNSDSRRILKNRDVNWDSLYRDDLKYFRTKLYKSSLENYDQAFEKSFDSWYQPYHYLPRTKWGIHIRHDSWMRTAYVFSHHCPSLLSKDFDSLKAGFLYLFTHMLFHYLTENAASVLEIIIKEPHIYKKYISNTYSKKFNRYSCIEEALANAYLFRKSEEFHINRKFLKDSLLSQGNGYRRFAEYLDSNFYRGIRCLISQMRYGSQTYGEPIEQILDISNPIDMVHGHRVPIWLHFKPKAQYSHVKAWF